MSVNDEVVLRCEVTGSPEPLVWWEFRGADKKSYALPGTRPHHLFHHIIQSVAFFANYMLTKHRIGSDIFSDRQTKLYKHVEASFKSISYLL